MSKCRIVAVCNAKGGVSKTSTAVNVAACLDALKYRVLAIDIDIQGNLSQHLGISTETLKTTIGDVLTNPELPIGKVTWKLGSLGVVPANLLLESAASHLSTRSIGGVMALKKKLEPVLDEYDFVIIDCPPSTGVLTHNALVAATDILIPIAVDYFSLLGVRQLLATVEDVKQLNPGLEIAGLVITRVDQRDKRIYKNVSDLLREQFGDKVYRTEIRKNTAIAESPSYGKAVIDVDPRSSGAQDYMSLAKEMLARWAD